MFLTKKYLSRRTVLRGAGVTLALPLLDAMIPAATALAQTAAVPRLRMGFFYIPHGAIQGNTAHGPQMDRWTPSGAGADFTLSPILASLEPHKRYVTSFGNLENRAMVGGVHSLAPATWLSGMRPDKSSAAASMSATLDQVVARHLGQDTTLPSLEVAAETTQQAAACSGSACFYNTTLSFRDAGSPLPMEYNPRKVFAQLFGEGDTPAERAAISNQTRSLLDRITERTRRLRQDLDAGDRVVLDGYLETVREIERRVQLASSRDLSGITVPEAPIGELNAFGAQVDLMFDLIALAYQADLTRVASYIMVAEGTNRTYNHIGVSDSFHPVSHHANGAFVFTGLYTSGGAQTRSFADVADFLLGLPQQATVQYGPGDVALTGRSLSLFAMDDWRARGNLTFNLGLRYELMRPFVESGDQLVNLDVTPDFTAAAPVIAGASGLFSGEFPDALLRTDANNLAPRIGVAWRGPMSLVIRGGYGVSFNAGSYGAIARQLASQPPFAVTNTNIGALNSALLLEDALSAGGADETTNNYGVDKDYVLGRVQTWNVDVNRSLGVPWTVGVNYTHTRGSSLDIVRAPNRDADGLRIPGVQPFTWQSAEGSSVLHSASFRLQRRPVAGIGGQVSYTLARSRDNAPSIGGGTGAAVVAQSDEDLDAEWALSNFDQRHRFAASANIELPFGENRRWLTGGGPWAALLDGWRVTATFSADAGTPLTPRVRGAATDVAQGLNGALRADYSGASIAAGDPGIDRFFNTSAFAVPTAGLFGTSGRNVIIGPGSRQLDAQLTRDVRLGGTRAVSIQVRANNLLNMVNYAAIDTWVNSPTFGQVLSVRPLRSAQLNLRFRF